jgi:hypothetical protein
MYQVHVEYSEYSLEKFEERLKSIRKIVVELDNRANAERLVSSRAVHQQAL